MTYTYTVQDDIPVHEILVTIIKTEILYDILVTMVTKTSYY